ncbi:MAG: sugar ABC transporter permease [Rubellimicrobium sp.]|nr:sugar ABC transporter permease [Rubellimicrobium sp.]
MSDRQILLLCLVPALLLLALTQFYPLAQSFYVSLHDWTLARSPVMGEFVGAQNYSRVLHDRQFTGALWFTLGLAAGSSILSVLLGFGLALLTVGENWKLRLSRTLLLLPMIIAPVAVGTVWRMMLAARIGPVNEALGALGLGTPNWLGSPGLAQVTLTVIDAWQWTPFSMIVMAAALASIPPDILAAARMDGAGRGLILRRIIVPITLPIILLVAMFRMVDALMTLDIVFTTTGGGPGFATHTLGYWIYVQGLRYFNISQAAAASWLLLALCMATAAAFLLWRRRIMSWQVRQ